jgi:2-iminobutanoate/2-iminopropanoate deaminase
MERRRIMPEDHPWYWSMDVPFSQGWRVGNLVFVGGQISADREGRAVGIGDIELQTRNTFENIGRVLRDAGATWNDVVKLNTYYCYDGPDEGLIPFWEQMTRVRMEFLPDPGPAGTAVRVPPSFPGMLLEVDAIAIVDE